MLEKWKKLDLEIDQRVQIIHYHVLSRVLYVRLAFWCDFTSKKEAEVTALMKVFLWGGGKPRINWETMTLLRDRGCVGLLNIRMYGRAVDVWRWRQCYDESLMAGWKEM